MSHHPHVHMIVPGGGISLDSTRWIGCRSNYLLPEKVLSYLSRYTHRVAISNSRLIAADATGVTFSYKDYRIEGPGRYNTMTLKPDEFIRRFLMHVLPNGFHRISCGLLASGTKTETIARARQLIATVAPVQTAHQPQPIVANLESGERQVMLHFDFSTTMTRGCCLWPPADSDERASHQYKRCSRQPMREGRHPPERPEQ